MKEPAKQFAIAPLNVRVGNASLDLAQALPVSIDAVINGHAPFKAEGTVTPEPLAAQLDVSLAKARMTILQPYVLPLADLTIKAGELGLKGKVRLDPPDAPGPDLSFDGDVTIDGFKSVDNALGKDLVNFRQVALGKLSVAMGPDAVSIDTITVSEPFARVIISPERVINIAAVLDPKGTAAALEARRAQAAAEAKMTPADKRRRDKELAQAESQAAKARKASGGAAAPPSPAPLPAEGMPIRIREVRIDNGTMDFTDLFVQPNFAAEVMRLDGTLAGLSSDPASHAKVDLKGAVGEFSPVTISGEIQPFAFERYTDIGLRFENISLPIFNPYSGRLSGYSIAKGKLTTDLHYLIQDRKLDAQHKIRIDQLEWGEETAAKGEATTAGQVRDGAAQGPQRSDRARRPGYRLDRRSEVPHRPDRLAGHQEHPRKGGHRAVRAARLAVRGCGGSAVRGFRAGQRHARSCERRAPGRALEEPGREARHQARRADRRAAGHRRAGTRCTRLRAAARGRDDVSACRGQQRRRASPLVRIART